MISIIVSAKKPVPKSPLELNIRKTVGVEHEVIIINNSKGKAGLAAVYNFGVQKSKGDILVFMHDDIFFMTKDWGKVVQERFSLQTDLGIIGVAGTQYLFSEKCSWTAAGRPFIKGRLVHHLPNDDFFITLFSSERQDCDVVCCTGVYMACRRELFDTVSFDETTFDGFCFHDIDLCMQVREKWRIMVTTDILIKHRSMGTFNEQWKLYGSRFLKKYAGSLPVSCCDFVPDLNNTSSAQVIDLKGKISQETIV
ncbi:Glycosyl transferase family 2 [Chitinispirillum alkaliphilum]|nr:Glycosyl transferase family 2 [Chitinispirillum alkaliphilum]